jgi:hypothetical protein
VSGAEAMRAKAIRGDDLLADTIEAREADIFRSHTSDN